MRFVDQPALRRQRADLGLIRSLTAERYGQFGASCDTPAASTTAALLPTKSKITRAPRLLVRFITRQHESASDINTESSQACRASSDLRLTGPLPMMRAGDSKRRNRLGARPPPRPRPCRPHRPQPATTPLFSCPRIEPARKTLAYRSLPGARSITSRSDRHSLAWHILKSTFPSP